MCVWGGVRMEYRRGCMRVRVRVSKRRVPTECGSKEGGRVRVSACQHTCQQACQQACERATRRVLVHGAVASCGDIRSACPPLHTPACVAVMRLSPIPVQRWCMHQAWVTTMLHRPGDCTETGPRPTSAATLPRRWRAIAANADGSKLAAVNNGCHGDVWLPVT